MNAQAASPSFPLIWKCADGTRMPPRVEMSSGIWTPKRCRYLLCHSLVHEDILYSRRPYYKHARRGQKHVGL